MISQFVKQSVKSKLKERPLASGKPQTANRSDAFAVSPCREDVTKTRSGERGTGNGSLGTSCQRKPPKKSKMAVQKTREGKEEYKERNSIVPWLKSDGDEIANQTHILRLRFEQVVCFLDIQPVSFTI